MAAQPPQPPPQGYDDKQVCYAEQHDLGMSKSHVGLPSDAPIPVSGPIPVAAAAAAAAPWPHHYQQQQQQQRQYSPPPPSSAIPNYPMDQHSSTANAAAHSIYPASVAPSTGWHSGSPPPPSAMYATTQGTFGPPPPPPHEMAARGGGDKDGLRILGLRPATFFLSIALVVVIVVAAVGGGVGGSIAVENAKRAAAASALSQNGTASAVVSTVTTTVSVRATGSSASGAEATPTPTPSRSAKIAVPPTQGVIDFDCTKVGSTLDISLGTRRSSFETLCGQDLIGSGIDILGIIVYNHAHCAQACASYNRNLGRNECVAVSFQADLEVLSNFGNCFLKNSTGSAQKKSNTQISYKLKLDG